MSASRYRTRVVDAELAARLDSIGAVLLEGPKACGKTETALQVAATVYRLDVDAAARTAAQVAPDLLLAAPGPVLLDEWQEEPRLWNHVRRAVDDRSPAKGLYVLTGSATPRDDAGRHSGAGRIGTVAMRPMSLTESGHSTGEISLASVFDGEDVGARDPGVGVPDLIERICVGGWPALLGSSPAQAAGWLADYLTQIVEVDIPALGSRRDPANVRRLLVTLSRNVGTPASTTALARDVGGAEGPISRITAGAYLDALTRLRLVEDSPAWAPHMRSATPLRAAETRYLVDPSLAVAALGWGPADLLADLNATGFLFENLVVRDLRVYAQRLGGSVHHWRDANGNEVDAIVTMPGSAWAAIEVKLNPTEVDRAASALLRLAGKVDHERSGPPAALAVVTSTGFAYRRPDGVLVIPITVLGP